MSDHKVLGFENPTNEELLTALRVCGDDSKGCRVCPLFKSKPCSNLFGVVADRIAQQEKQIESLQRERQEPEPKRAFAAFNWERDNELGDVYICQECGRQMYGNGHKYCSGCGLPLYYDEDYTPDPKQEPEPLSCDGCEQPPHLCKGCTRAAVKDYYATEPKGEAT